MITKVSNPTALKKRLDRFFFDSVPARTGLSKFVTDLTEITEAYAFGGLIRDIAFDGTRKFASDVDIVYRGESEAVTRFIQCFPYKTNKFGGARIEVQSWLIDIWPVEQTWAFSTGAQDYSCVQSLLNTTITTWDSALYSLNDKSLILGDKFFSGMESGTLDLVLAENPNRLGLLVRLMRHLSGERVKAITPTVSELLMRALQDHRACEIVEYEGESYEQRLLTEDFIKSVRTALTSTNDECENRSWENRQLCLGFDQYEQRLLADDFINSLNAALASINDESENTSWENRQLCLGLDQPKVGV